jgi:uncharacterized membrane protein
MATGPDDPPYPVRTARAASRSVYQSAVDVVLTGVVTLLPVVVTVYVLNAALGIIVTVLDPFVKILRFLGVLGTVQSNVVVAFLVEVGIYGSTVEFVSEITAMLILGVVVVVVGSLARNRYGERLVDAFDYLFSIVPGLGSVYRGFRRMGDAVLESEAENFRSVKLVEFPRDGAFVLGFETASPPRSIRRSAHEAEMTTLFLPLAPNPVMGGFLAHLPDDRIRDVDMTVEEGIQSVVTSGIAVGEEASLDREELREMGVDPDLADGAAAEED